MPSDESPREIGLLRWLFSSPRWQSDAGGTAPECPGASRKRSELAAGPSGVGVLAPRSGSAGGGSRPGPTNEPDPPGSGSAGAGWGAEPSAPERYAGGQAGLAGPARAG